MLQIPTEVPWLHRSMNAIIRTLKQIWQTKADFKDAAVYSEWLTKLLDVRGWARRLIAPAINAGAIGPVDAMACSKHAIKRDRLAASSSNPLHIV
jgi:hypothetical protein